MTYNRPYEFVCAGRREARSKRVLVHEPSGEAFDSITQLAVFHRGWQAATDADAEDN
jgi:hypothetical protein